MKEFDLSGYQGEKRQKKMRGVADIVFCIDISGSMKPLMEGLSNSLDIFIKKIKEENILKDVRIKLVTFSDLVKDTDPKHAFNMNRPYHNLLDEVGHNAIIESMEDIKNEVEGGDDDPESSLDAIYRVATSCFDRPYTERTRIIILFTDAEARDKLDESTGAGPIDIIEAVAGIMSDDHVKLFIFGPDSEKRYKEITDRLGSPSEFVPVEEGKGFESMDFQKIMNVLGKTVSEFSQIIE